MATRRVPAPPPPPPPPEEPDPGEGLEELPPDQPETTSTKLIAATPWWAISVGLHALAMFIGIFFWQAGQTEAEEAVTVSPPRRPRPLPEMEKPKDLDPNKKLLDIKDKQVEDPVYRKDVQESDHNETADDEEFEKAKGDSLDFVSDKPFKGKGTYDVIGGGGGGGGRYGGRLGGKRDLVTRGGGGGDTEDAVLAALKWLSRHQSPDGCWKITGYIDECNKVQRYQGGKCAPNPGESSFDTGVTGLSLLAFLGAGYSHLSKDTYDGICFGDVVRKGLQWLMSQQDAAGCIGPRSAQKYMYNHTICALAMSEAYGLTGSNLFKDQAQKSVNFVIAAQNPGLGWRYSEQCGDNDSSVTGWAAMVLKSAEISGLTFPKTGYDGARAWFDEVTNTDAYGRVGYTHMNTGKVYVPGMNEEFDHHEALTAIGVMARIFMDKNKGDARVRDGCDLLLRDKPVWDGNKIDYYYWYYASLALYQYDGPSGAKWKSWNEDMKNSLVKNQNTASSGCKSGSWETVDRWSGEGGRVYGTAINALTLEVYYRYASVFGVK